MAYDANSHRLDGKVALVSGGARGLGATMAATFAAAGATVIIADILDDIGQRFAGSINASGGKAFFLHHDVTAESDWTAAMHRATAEGGLDILVNNAGIERVSLTSQQSLEDFERVLKVNVSGVFLGCKHAIPAMSPGTGTGRGGSIINVSSVAGKVGMAGLAAYCASKGAVTVMTKSIALECAALKTGIRVNSIHPGAVMTDMAKALPQKVADNGLAPDAESVMAALKAGHPLGRFGTPQDIANGALFLASDASGWMTGSELVIDGGYTSQ